MGRPRLASIVGLTVCALAAVLLIVWGRAQFSFVTRDAPLLGLRNAVFADTVPIARARASGRSADALAAARRLVITAPNDPSALRVYGLMLIDNGDVVRGEAIMRQAGRLGWSDLPTQLFWADVAHRAGDDDVAVLRADAAMRLVAGDDPAVADRMRAIEAAPGGVARVAARLKTLPNWGDVYLSDVGPVADAALAARAALVSALLVSHTVVGADVAAIAEQSLLDRIRPDLGRQIWASRPGIDKAEHVARFGDPGDTNDVRRSPFAWHYPGASGVGLSPSSNGGLQGSAMNMLVTDFATTTLTLTAGPWRMDVPVAASEMPARLSVALFCMPGTRTIPLASERTRDRMSVRVVIPTNCASQTLMLRVGGTDAGPGTFTVGLPALSKARVSDLAAAWRDSGVNSN